MKVFFFVWLAILSALILGGCASLAAEGRSEVGSEGASTPPIRVVATTGMVSDVVKNVGGERIQITSLMGPGVDPHLFKPSERTVISLATAGVEFFILACISKQG